MSEPDSDPNSKHDKMATSLARGILHDKTLRRKMMGQLVIVLLVAVAFGTWGIDSWLEQSILRYGFYWGGVMLFAVMILLLSLYDLSRLKRDM